MSRLFCAASMFLFFGALAMVCCFFTYGILFTVVNLTAHALGLPATWSWIPIGFTALVFLVAVVTAIRHRLPEISRLSWDSGTVEDSPSRSRISGAGGQYWNVNPLGPQSLGSIASLGAMFLCLGPSLAITAVISAAEEWKRKD
jgi:hypothetical protein